MANDKDKEDFSAKLVEVKAMLGSSKQVQRNQKPETQPNKKDLLNENEKQENRSQNKDNQYNQFRGPRGGRGRGNRGRGRGRGGVYYGGTYTDCPICGFNNHSIYFCKSYEHGQAMRDKLKQLKRCDACLVSQDGHQTECAKHFKPCRYCNSMSHQSITCDGLAHPGSWLVNQNK